MLGAEPPWTVRGTAAQLLGRLRDSRATLPLIDLLADPDESVRVTAIWALTRIRDARATGALRTALRDESSVVRSWAALGLGRLRDRESIPELIAILQDEPIVRYRAAAALGMIGDRSAAKPLGRQLLRGGFWHRVRALFALLRCLA